MLYSRLNLFRTLSAQLVSSKLGGTQNNEATSEQNDPNGSKASFARNPSHFYEMLLGLCERLFENEIEQHIFEDQMRAVFGLKVGH